MRRVVITTEAVNSYGTRVLTAGIDLVQYEKNPVLLYMHRRGEVIGVMKDLRVEGDRVTGEPEFDEASELSRRCKAQWEKGVLKMVSVGLDVLETSGEAAAVVEGQTCATIVRSRLFEVSVVDVGANDEAMVLTHGGREITLGQGGENPLPRLETRTDKEKNMDAKMFAQVLGLPETADEAAVKSRLSEMLAAEAEAKQLREEKATLEAARVEELVAGAIGAGKIGESSRAQFVKLGKDLGSARLDETLKAMVAPRVSLTAQLAGGKPQEATYKSLHEVPERELLKLRKEQPEEYARLYKAEYGMELPAEA